MRTCVSTDARQTFTFSIYSLHILSFSLSLPPLPLSVFLLLFLLLPVSSFFLSPIRILFVSDEDCELYDAADAVLHPAQYHRLDNICGSTFTYKCSVQLLVQTENLK